MKQALSNILPYWLCARTAQIALLLLFAISASRTALGQAATWKANDAFQAYDAYVSPSYFLWSDQNADRVKYSIIVDKKGEKAWHTFWQEVEKIALAEDAYDRAAERKESALKTRYKDQINELCQGFIDKMHPLSNFGDGLPWGKKHGDPYDWHGKGVEDTDYSSQGNPRATSSGPGDWFNDDLMWAAIVFARAHQITGEQGWQTAAENQVDYVWANAQAQTNAIDGGKDGTVVGLMQAFCNKNGGKDGDCEPSPVSSRAAPRWAPNLDAEVNFTFVIAADLLANDTTVKSEHYRHARDAVYAWAMANLYTETSDQAKACTESSGTICAEIYDNNNTHTFNGEQGHWSKYKVPSEPCKKPSSPSSNPSCWDFSMNYGNAIEAAVRMGHPEKAQRIANYLMWGMSNPRHPYAGVYHWDANTKYNILPYYGPEKDVVIDGVHAKVPSDYDEGSNYAGSNGIALRGVAYGLYHHALNRTTLEWARANVQAAWNNKNADKVMWDDWAPGHVTGSYKYSENKYSENKKHDYVYDSWDCSDAVAGLLTVPAPE